MTGPNNQQQRATVPSRLQEQSLPGSTASKSPTSNVRKAGKYRSRTPRPLSQITATPAGAKVLGVRPAWAMPGMPVTSIVQSGRVEKQCIVHPKPRDQYSINSGTPMVLDPMQTLRWEATKVVDSNGKYVDIKSLSSSEGQAYVNIGITYISAEEFRIIALVANDIRNLFPLENVEYWNAMIENFNKFQRISDEHREGSRGNIKYYWDQLHLVGGIYQTLEKSVTGYRKLYQRYLQDDKLQDLDFLEVQTKLWGLVYHINDLSRLREAFDARGDDLRRFSICLRQTRRSPASLGLPEFSKMSEVAHEIGRGINFLISEILDAQQFIIESGAIPSKALRKKMAQTAESKMAANHSMMEMFQLHKTNREWKKAPAYLLPRGSVIGSVTTISDPTLIYLNLD